MAYKFYLYWLQRLKSLEILDASLVSRNISIPDAKAHRDQRTNAPFLAPKWYTIEFYFYYISVLTVVGMMIKTATDFSKGELCACPTRRQSSR